jgi:multiple sugar transport system permease protein/raffinose/stachyose/melibiose transport system permease protein
MRRFRILDPKAALSGAPAAAFILAACLFTLYPVAYAVVGSFKTNQELTVGGRFLPSKWMAANYYQAFIQADFLRYFTNSVVVSASSMVIALIISSLAGYVLARYAFIGKRCIMTMFLSLMFVSIGAVSLQPIFMLLRSLGLTKSVAGLVLALTGAQTANTLLVMGYVKGIPRELDEAAVIDGCSIGSIFVHVILPLIRPIVGVVALFAFRNAWNDYVTTLIMTIPRPEFMTISVAVVQLKYSINAAAEWHIMLAGASIAIVPILIVYLFTNKQFIAGLTAGSIKG